MYITEYQLKDILKDSDKIFESVEVISLFFDMNERIDNITEVYNFLREHLSENQFNNFIEFCLSRKYVKCIDVYVPINLIKKYDLFSSNFNIILNNYNRRCKKENIKNLYMNNKEFIIELFKYDDGFFALINSLTDDKISTESMNMICDIIHESRRTRPGFILLSWLYENNPVYLLNNYDAITIIEKLIVPLMNNVKLFSLKKKEDLEYFRSLVRLSLKQRKPQYLDDLTLSIFKYFQYELEEEILLDIFFEIISNIDKNDTIVGLKVIKQRFSNILSNKKLIKRIINEIPDKISFINFLDEEIIIELINNKDYIKLERIDNLLEEFFSKKDINLNFNIIENLAKSFDDVIWTLSFTNLFIEKKVFKEKNDFLYFLNNYPNFLFHASISNKKTIIGLLYDFIIKNPNEFYDNLDKIIISTLSFPGIFKYNKDVNDKNIFIIKKFIECTFEKYIDGESNINEINHKTFDIDFYELSETAQYFYLLKICNFYTHNQTGGYFDPFEFASSLKYFKNNKLIKRINMERNLSKQNNNI